MSRKTQKLISSIIVIVLVLAMAVTTLVGLF